MIENCFYIFEKASAEKFEMYDESRRNELEEKNLNHAKEIILKRIYDEEEKAKIDEE